MEVVCLVVTPAKRSADSFCGRRANLDINRQHFEAAEPISKRRHSYACPTTPPREFFCPVSKCLMTEPVLLLNTGVTLSRTALQAWLRTGAPCFIMLRHACMSACTSCTCAALFSHVLMVLPHVLMMHGG